MSLHLVEHNQNLLNLIRANTPFIYVKTTEFWRANILLNELFSKLNDRKVNVWKSTEGLKVKEKNGSSYNVKYLGIDLYNALEKIKDSEPSYNIFYNIRFLMHNTGLLTQKLIDTYEYARANNIVCIFVGAHFDFPVEVNSLFTYYDLSLPSFLEIYDFLKNFLSSQKIFFAEEDLLRISGKIVGLTLFQIENIVCLSLVKFNTLNEEFLSFEKQNIIKRTNILELVPVSDDFALGGYFRFKKWLDVKKYLLFNHFNDKRLLSLFKGILLVGLPGTGKSLCAKYIAKTLNLPLLKLDFSSVFNSLVGSSEYNLRTALSIIDQCSPVVLWIDEIEKVLSGRKSSEKLDSGTTSRVVSIFLTWLQERKSFSFIVGTANNINLLSPELLRKGRFSEIWGVIEPTKEELFEIWKIWLDKFGIKLSNKDISYLVELTIGYTGAEIEHIVTEIFGESLFNKKKITLKTFEQYINNFIPQNKLHGLADIRNFICSHFKLV